MNRKKRRERREKEREKKREEREIKEGEKRKIKRGREKRKGKKKRSVQACKDIPIYTLTVTEGQDSFGMSAKVAV